MYWGVSDTLFSSLMYLCSRCIIGCLYVCSEICLYVHGGQWPALLLYCHILIIFWSFTYTHVIHKSINHTQHVEKIIWLRGYETTVQSTNWCLLAEFEKGDQKKKKKILWKSYTKKIVLELDGLLFRGRIEIKNSATGKHISMGIKYIKFFKKISENLS